MKIRFFIFALGLAVSIRSPLMAQCGWNSSPNPNYCCGNDPELQPQLNTHQVYDWGNFCNLGNYNQVTGPTVTYLSGKDWILIWNDGFDHYTKLDNSFYMPASPFSFNAEITGRALPDISKLDSIKYMEDPGLIKINQSGNGKLQLFESYDTNPLRKTPLYKWGEPTAIPDPANPSGPPITEYHSDFNVGFLATRFHFPKSCQVEASIKTYPVNTVSQWPSFWMFGDKALELDIFEMPFQSVGFNSSFNNKQIIMTYHAPINGTGTNKPEALIHVFGSSGFVPGIFPPLNTQFNTYGVIWDDWKVKWLFNSNVIHSANRFYKMFNSWSSNKRKKNYRSIPVESEAAFTNHSNQLFTENKHFPGFDFYNTDPLQIILANGFNTKIDLDNNIDPNESMDMDYLKVWIKTDCSASKNINSENIHVTYKGFYNPPSPSNPNSWPSLWMKREYLETGGNVIFGSGNNVTIDNSQIGIFVASDEVGFEPGFSVNYGGSVFVYTSICIGPWDDLKGTEDDKDSNSWPNDDNEPYYYPDGTVDESDWVELAKNHGNERLIHGPDPESNGIIDMPTDASANNPYTNRDILVKTEDGGYTIESVGAKITAIELYDAKGALILKESNRDSNSYTISRSLLSEGLYTCMVYTTMGFDVRKLWVWK